VKKSREVIFIRTTKENQKWAQKRSKELGLSTSEYFHKLITKLRLKPKQKRVEPESEEASIYPKFR